jgi:hypothetical protein
MEERDTLFWSQSGNGQIYSQLSLSYSFMAIEREIGWKKNHRLSAEPAGERGRRGMGSKVCYGWKEREERVERKKIRVAEFIR